MEVKDPVLLEVLAEYIPSTDPWTLHELSPKTAVGSGRLDPSIRTISKTRSIGSGPDS